MCYMWSGSRKKIFFQLLMLSVLGYNGIKYIFCWFIYQRYFGQFTSTDTYFIKYLVLSLSKKRKQSDKIHGDFCSDFISWQYILYTRTMHVIGIFAKLAHPFIYRLYVYNILYIYSYFVLKPNHFVDQTNQRVRVSENFICIAYLKRNVPYQI